MGRGVAMEQKKTQFTSLICPKCKSNNIAQFRMMTGAIWCDDCNFRVDHKEKHNPFIVNLGLKLKNP
jgi:hypothetical protein